MEVSLILLLKILLCTGMTTFVFIEFVTPISVWLGLVDRPNNTRKHHVGDIPLAGGIAVFISTLLGCCFWLSEQLELFKFFLLASSFVVFLGVLDDKYELSVRARLVGQTIVSFLLVIGAQIHLTSFGDLLGSGPITFNATFSFLVTVFAVLAVINAFNMLDGMDGLLGSISIVPLMSVGFLMGATGNSAFAVLALIISTAIAPFLIYNIGIPGNKFSKIFLGDAGSMFLGLSVVFFMIAGTQGETTSFKPVTALWLTAIPLMDLATVTARRIYNKTPIVSADKEHLHHTLLRAGFSRKQILVGVVLFSLLFSALGIYGELAGIAEHIMFTGFIACFGAYFLLIHGRFRDQKVSFILANALANRKQARIS